MNDTSASPSCGEPPAADSRDEHRDWAVLAQQCRYQREPLRKLLQVSQRTLDRYFKKHLMTTVGTWLRELQLTDAYEQIYSGKSLKEAAFAVGFKQASHFTRRFKGRFGILPSTLRGTPQEVLRARLREAVTAKTMTPRWGGSLLDSSEETLSSRGRFVPILQVF
jgi:AraC-like DNA-binding protein